MRTLPILVLPLLLLAACQTEPERADTAEDRVEQARVDSFRATLDDDLQRADRAIGEVEGRSPAAEDSADYRSMLERLREDREEVGRRVDSLAHLTPDGFETAESRLRSDVRSLARRADRARVETATTAEELRTTVRSWLSTVDEELGRLGAGRDGDGLAEVQRERAEVEAQLNQLGDAADDRFREVRRDIAGRVDRINERLHSARDDRRDAEHGDGTHADTAAAAR